MHFAGLMDLTGQFQDALGGRGFTGVNVGEIPMFLYSDNSVIVLLNG